MASRSPENACNPPRDSLQRIVVLGIGNMLWADEGFGVRCVEALQQRFEFAPHVELVDGGTQGLALLQYVQEADALLILDAIDYGLAPGTRWAEVPDTWVCPDCGTHKADFEMVAA